MPKLIIRPGTPQAQEFELKPGKNFVGRGFANDLKLEDASVSGSHALIEVNGNQVTVTDQGSTNGTRINQLPATQSPLQSGATLKLGAVELLYIADAATPTLPSVGAPPPPPTAAAQIATEFVIRDPSRVGVAPAALAPPPPPPAQVGVELRIPGIAPAAPPPPPVSVGDAPIFIPPSTGVRVPSAAPSPPPPTPIVVAQAAPAPAPLATGGLKLTGMNHAPAPVQAVPVAAALPVPITQPPAAPPVPPTASAGLLEAPQGKTACKFHKNTPGQWLCQKCAELFCSLCVSTRPTPAGAGYFCRACGTQCEPVKVKFTAKKEKTLTAYTDATILLRTVGFGGGAALLGAGLWTGFAALTGIDIPPIFAVIIGAICGYAVKIASQDRPGVFFSITAIVMTLIGSVLGKFGAVLVTHIFLFSINSLAVAIFGLLSGMFLAWKVGGGDF